MNRIIRRCVAAALLALAIPAAAQEGKKLTIGFSQVGAESAWRTAETKSIKDEAAKRNIDLKFVDAQNKQANQMKAIRSFITQKVDAIILAPQIETGWEPVLKEAREAKIPVFLVDRGIETADDSLYVTKIASDFIDEGRRAAAWLADTTHGQANIVELQGTTGSAPAIDRQKGFAEELKKHEGGGGMKIVKTQSANFERAKGKEVMQALLKADPQRTITAVYAHNDDMALGAIQAIEEAGLKPGKDLVLISIDGIGDAFQSMVDGKLNATVECNPLLGPAVFDAIDKHRAGQTLPKWIKQQDQLFDQSTAADAIKTRQY